MKRVLMGMIALMLLAAVPVFAGHIIDQATFGEGPAYSPSVAVSTFNYTAIAYITEFPGIFEPHVVVQLVPTNPYPEQAWPEPVCFGPGSDPKVCWSSEGFTLGFVSGNAVMLYQSDKFCVWDMANPQIYYPGPPVVGFDLWGVAQEWEGLPVYLTVDTASYPPSGNCRVYSAFLSPEYGWSYLSQVLGELSGQPMSRARTTPGRSGPEPAIYYMMGEYESELYYTVRSGGFWSYPEPVPGDDDLYSGIGGAFDVQAGHFLGLGVEMACPCRHVLFKEYNAATGQWAESVNVTVDHGYMNNAQSPSMAYAGDNTAHLFWMQETYNNTLGHDRDHLEYWTFKDGVYTDCGDFLDGILAGVGSRVDISVMPFDRPTVMAWSRTDTLDGVPQPERIFMARYDDLSPVEPEAIPQPARGLTAWPNPFNPRINLTVAMDAGSTLQLDIYDARGLHVARLHDGLVTGSERNFIWDGTSSTGQSVPSGVYFVQAITPGGQMTEKVVLAE